jgi:hypothetical protein
MHIERFSDFWPYYVRQHASPGTRVLHAIGSVLALILLGLAFAVNLWLLLAVPLVGYAFAWYAHFFVERNKPATFTHPLWSLIGDFHMYGLMWAGRMEREIRRLDGGDR